MKIVSQALIEPLITGRKINQIRNNLVVVTDENNEYHVIKSDRQTGKSKPFNSHRFRNEKRVYEALMLGKYNFLRFPKLLSCGRTHLMLEFVEQDTKRPTEAAFSKAYLELQRLSVPANFFMDLKNQLVRGFFFHSIVVCLKSLRKKTGWKTAFKTILTLLSLNLKAPKVGSRYWIHGDLTDSNVFLKKGTEEVFFIDFENMSVTRKWLILEVVGKSLQYDYLTGFSINFQYINSYLDSTNVEVRDDLRKIDMRQQFRFAVMIRCIYITSSARFKSKVYDYLRLLKTCLNEECFNRWYDNNVLPGLATNPSIA